jgi:hypothetical protein
MALAQTGLMDTGPEQSLDDLAALAASVTGARRAFITLVDARRSFWKASVEIPPDAEPGAEPGGGPDGGQAEPVLRESWVRDNFEHPLIALGLTM